MPLVDCVFVAHPSFIDLPGDVKRVAIPLSVAVGDKDMAMKEPAAKQMKEILDARNDERYEAKILPGAKHGFAVRSHPEDKHEMAMALLAETQAIEWFNKCMT